MTLILFHIAIIAVLMGGCLTVAWHYRLKYRQASRQIYDLKILNYDALTMIDGLVKYRGHDKKIVPASDCINPKDLMEGFVEGMYEKAPEYPGINSTPFEIVMSEDWNQHLQIEDLGDIFTMMGIPADRQGWKAVSSNELK